MNKEPLNLKAQAVIPCKSYSKRIPNKNFYLLDGKPLFVHTLQRLLKADFLYQIVIDTDNTEKVTKLIYKHIPSKHIIKKIMVHKRPNELAQDSTPINAPICHLLEKQKEKNSMPEYTFLVYACAILIEIQEMEEAINILNNHPHYLTVNNVVPGPNPEHSLALKREPTTKKEPTIKDKDSSLFAHWQIRKEEFKNSSFPQAFYPSENFELARSKALLGNPRFYDLLGPCIVSNPRKAVLLDNPVDLEVMKAFYYYDKSL